MPRCSRIAGSSRSANRRGGDPEDSSSGSRATRRRRAQPELRHRRERHDQLLRPGRVPTRSRSSRDGKILVAGFAFSSGIDGDFALARYNADGTLDTSFDTDGKVTTDLGTNYDGARAIAIQPDGGSSSSAPPARTSPSLATRPTASSTRASATAGQITDLGFSDVANGVALTPAGQIVIAGYTVGANSNWDFLLARYRSDGTLDSTFGSGGNVNTDLAAAMTSPRTSRSTRRAHHPRRPGDQLDNPRHGARPLQPLTAPRTRASTATAS